MKLSTLIGKQLLTPAGESLGYVKNASTNAARTKLQCLFCIDGEEEEFFIPARAVLSVKDVVVVGKGRQSAPTGNPCPIGTPAYSHTGESLGVVSDLFLSETDPYYELDNAPINRYPVDLTSLADVLIVYPDEKTKRALAPKRKYRRRNASERGTNNAIADAFTVPFIEEPVRKTKSSCDFSASALVDAETKNSVTESISFSAENSKDSVSNATVTASSENALGRETADPQEPSKAGENDRRLSAAKYGDSRVNLLGKLVKKSVYDSNGYPIAMKGDLITAEIIKQARIHNRLLQLTVNTLTNLS